MRQVDEPRQQRPARSGRVVPREQGWRRYLGRSAPAAPGWPTHVAMGLFLVSAFVYAMHIGGQFAVVGASVARIGNVAAGVAGLSAYNVSISGLKRASRQDIFRIVGIAEGGSIVGFDAHRARRRLEAENWIASASILRQFPNTIHIEIVEREPFALWQRGGRFSVIDKSGTVLDRFAVRDNMELPIVVGTGAETGAHKLINELEVWSDIRSRMQAAARVAERRWTLYMANGIKVLLPERGVEQALHELDGMHRGQDVLNRAVDVIDLRAQDRIVLRLSDKAAKSRTAELATVSRR